MAAMIFDTKYKQCYTHVVWNFTGQCLRRPMLCFSENKIAIL